MTKTRRAFDMILPLWTASDPCERLGPRVESRLRLISRILDSITALLIKDHANREIRTAPYAPKTGTQSLGPNPLQKMQEAKTRLTATYPRLNAEATIKELLAHVSDLSTYEYWGDLCSDPNSISGPTHATALAVANLRAECLDVYQCIWTKLEEQDAKEVLGASDAIRFRLLSLESLLGYYKLTYQKLPRRSLNLESSKTASPKTSSAAPVIGITTVVIFSTFIPLGFAWSYAESKTEGLPDMDFFFLIQNTIMQLLGIFITIYPIWSSKKPSKRPWYWALGFTIVGFICSFGSLPLYWYLPKFWSGFASFAGNVAQISTSVQLVLLATSQPERVKQA